MSLISRQVSSQQEFVLRQGRVPAQKCNNVRRHKLLEDFYRNVKNLTSNKSESLLTFY